MLIAKPGLDGHDRGALLVARALRDGGIEVIYSGLHQTPADIAMTAVHEDVSVVGLSVLTGGHVGLTRKVLERLGELGGEDIAVVVGGVIPAHDVGPLLELGVTAVYPSSTKLDRIVSDMKRLALETGSAPDAPKTVREAAIDASHR